MPDGKVPFKHHSCIVNRRKGSKDDTERPSGGSFLNFIPNVSLPCAASAHYANTDPATYYYLLYFAHCIVQYIVLLHSYSHRLIAHWLPFFVFELGDPDSPNEVSCLWVPPSFL